MATTVIITSVTMDRNCFLLVQGTVNGAPSSCTLPLSEVSAIASVAMIQDYLALKLCGSTGITAPVAVTALTGTVTL